MKKRILLIAYSFPPCGGPRSLRWVRLIRHLGANRAFDVLTVRHDRGVGAYERDGEALIPPGTDVIRTYPGPIYRLAYRHLPPGSPGGAHEGGRSGLRRGLKASFRSTLEAFLIPDRRVEWFPWGYAALRRLLKERSYEAVISSALPVTSHLLGAAARKDAGIPWIADYGDPGALNEFEPFPLRRRIIDKRLEAALLKRMDGIVFTVKDHAESYLSHFPFLDPEKLIIIPNACDEEEFAASRAERGNKFRIVYTGIFYKGPNPMAFFEALARLDFDFEVMVAGNIWFPYADKLRMMGLESKVTFLGHCSHARALALQKGADVLLLLGWGKGLQIPGKLCEYFGAGRPILAVHSDEGEIAAGLIRSHRRGTAVRGRPEDIAAAVGRLHDLWKKGELDRSFDLGPLREYTTAFQARNLEAFIEKTVSKTRPA